MMSNIERCYHLQWQKISPYSLYLNATGPDLSHLEMQGSIWEAKDNVRNQVGGLHETLNVNNSPESALIEELSNLIEQRFSNTN